MVYFFFQAEDGIRDFHVTGVQTCALPIYILCELAHDVAEQLTEDQRFSDPELKAQRNPGEINATVLQNLRQILLRSEERRVGKECRSRGSQYQDYKRVIVK